MIWGRMIACRLLGFEQEVAEGSVLVGCWGGRWGKMIWGKMKECACVELRFGEAESSNEALLSEGSPFAPIERDRVILMNDVAIAFFDGFPVSKGHALVVPRRVVGSLYELDDDMQAAIWETVRLTREFLENRFHSDAQGQTFYAC